MSKKDFELIARTIAGLSLENPVDRLHIAERFAGNLAQTNPRFDRARFIKAATNG